MKKRIVIILLVTVMTASVFTGCGNKTEGDRNIQAVMADAGNGQKDSENGTDGDGAAETTPETTAEPTESPAPIATVKPTESPAPTATAEPTATPTEEPTSTAQPKEGKGPETAADSSEDTAVNNSTNTSQQSTEANNTTQGTTANNDTSAAANDTAANNSSNDEVTTSKSLSQAFVDYLNQKRAEQGLSQVTWNSGYESYVLSRAEQLSTNFSHDGMTVSEIILATDSSDPASWWGSFSESYGHNLEISDPHLSSGAAAYMSVGNYYYVIFAYDKTPITAEEIQEQIDSGEMIAGSTTYTDSNGDEQPTSYYTAGDESYNYSSPEEAENSGNLTPEQIEFLKSIGQM